MYSYYVGTRIKAIVSPLDIKDANCTNVEIQDHVLVLHQVDFLSDSEGIKQMEKSLRNTSKWWKPYWMLSNIERFGLVKHG
jgi:hypothetical protein